MQNRFLGAYCFFITPARSKTRLPWRHLSFHAERTLMDGAISTKRGRDQGREKVSDSLTLRDRKAMK
jgi:hypothetical protein